ncbi:BlaR1 peptidase M56 [Chishuiella changwenlii]|uniref:BlaR1 peptidase M56 n=2 Tax=Chishuiella changwenlii TaxID=1434701 RepID=A0A1M6VX55_9FLAO|nr:BlaR1 peptidase M56 [Chishuiella changwenlii]
MIAYLIKFILCSGFLYSFYKLLLERESMYKINRFYLIFALLFSLTAPLYKIDLPISTSETNISPELLAFIMQNPELFQQEEGISLGSILGFIVGIICVILLVKFIYNLFELLFKINTDEKIKDKEITYVLDLESEQPYSFWKYIFIPEKQLNQLHQNLIDHEKAHCIQKHSFDILFIEIFQIIFWFNPFVYFYKKSIKLNHEFLADEYVLQKETDIKTYQHQILDCIATQSPSIMASNFNFILTKKRLIMMTKNTSQRKIKFLSFASLPFILSAFVLFSQKSFAQEVEKNAQKVEETLDKTVKSQADDIFGSKNNLAIKDTIKKSGSFNTIANSDSSKASDIKSIDVNKKNNQVIIVKNNNDTIYKSVSTFSQNSNKPIIIKDLKINDVITSDVKKSLEDLNVKDIKAINVIKNDKKMIITMNDSITYNYNLDDKKLTALKKGDISFLKNEKDNLKKNFNISIDPKNVIVKDGFSIYIDDKGVEHKVNNTKINKIYISNKSGNDNVVVNGKNVGTSNTYTYTYTSNDNKSIDEQIKDLKQKELNTKKQIKSLEKLKKEQKDKK